MEVKGEGRDEVAEAAEAAETAETAEATAEAAFRTKSFQPTLRSPILCMPSFVPWQRAPPLYLLAELEARDKQIAENWLPHCRFQYLQRLYCQLLPRSDRAL